jgi:tRNA(Leu) C34 or U34 (ribose-2'-O)-methylase TrmL
MKREMRKTKIPAVEPHSVILSNPKYPHNVGAAIRAASCFGAAQVWFTGTRVPVEGHDGFRLPREERMKGYKDVDLINYDYPFDQMVRGLTPVAIELRPGSESLADFVHPENPVYVFGPEDGSIPQVFLRHCPVRGDPHAPLREPGGRCLLGPLRPTAQAAPGRDRTLQRHVRGSS